MKCPKCDGLSGIINTAALDTVVWRERKCKMCGHKWTTSEMEDEPMIPVHTLRNEKR